MTLTEEEEKKIYEEERYRAESRKQLDKEAISKKSKKQMGCLLKCFGIIIVLGAIGSVMSGLSSKNESSINPQTTISQPTRLDDRATYTKQVKDGITSYVILFDSPLPLTEDEIRMSNTTFSVEVEIAIARLYGKNATTGKLFNFSMETRDGINYLIVPASDGGKFVVMVFREKQSGNVFSFGLWKE